MDTRFKPGFDERRNTQGRPKGVPNKKAEKIRQQIAKFLEGKTPELVTLWKALGDPKTRPAARERLAFFERLLRHVLPAPKTGDILEDMSEQDMDKLIDYLRKNLN